MGVAHLIKDLEKAEAIYDKDKNYMDLAIALALAEEEFVNYESTAARELHRIFALTYTKLAGYEDVGAQLDVLGVRKEIAKKRVRKSEMSSSNGESSDVDVSAPNLDYKVLARLQKRGIVLQ